MADEEVTLHEVKRAVEVLHEDIRELRRLQDERYTALLAESRAYTDQVARSEVSLTENKLANVKNRLEALEGMQTWLLRLILGLIAAAVISGILIRN